MASCASCCLRASYKSFSGAGPWLAAFQRLQKTSVVRPALLSLKSTAPSARVTLYPSRVQARSSAAEKSRHDIAERVSSVAVSLASLGRCQVFQPEIAPVTKKGNAIGQAKCAYCTGSNQRANKAKLAAMTKLIQNGARISWAYKDFSDILKRTYLLSCRLLTKARRVV